MLCQFRCTPNMDVIRVAGMDGPKILQEHARVRVEDEDVRENVVWQEPVCKCGQLDSV